MTISFIRRKEVNKLEKAKGRNWQEHHFKKNFRAIWEKLETGNMEPTSEAWSLDKEAEV